MEQFIIGVINKDLFAKRLHVEDEEFSMILYEQLIFVLSSIGEEVTQGVCDYRMGVYLDTKNEGVKKYKLNKEAYWSVREKFGHNFYKELEKYSLREQKKGTDVLFQLNSGKLSMDDFNGKF